MHGLKLLIEANPVVTNGIHYWRLVSEYGNGPDQENADAGHLKHVIAWSRILDNQELLCVINLHHQKEAIVYVTIDNDLHKPGSMMHRLYGPS